MMTLNFWKALWIQFAVLFFITFQFLVLTDLIHWFGWERPSSPSFIVELEVYTSALLLGEPSEGKTGDPWWIKINYTIGCIVCVTLLNNHWIIDNLHACEEVHVKYNTHIQLFRELKNVTLMIIFSRCATIDENDLLCK